eukprot:CAMPEP_0167809990 /NCGR_PEP_ID=MMETSP0111_2-20121227/24120_1 /TAXON_ID=91324 /ORGANISM="Lotharella globosa, Strain CCCM811" /LENGTH=148 /DNA_ID=CAMNT_0007708475 /DNA_START=503 /DNA_END=949 /DNA_ORIENTATION=-
MPVLITKCRRVPQGTNGAMSMSGTIASILGGAFIGAVYYFMSAQDAGKERGPNDAEIPPQWPIILLGACAGFLGSLVDSILGSLFQYSGWAASRQVIVQRPEKGAKHISGMDLLTNNQVNFLSAFATSVACGWFAPAFFDYFHETART